MVSHPKVWPQMVIPSFAWRSHHICGFRAVPAHHTSFEYAGGFYCFVSFLALPVGELGLAADPAAAVAD